MNQLERDRVRERERQRELGGCKPSAGYKGVGAQMCRMVTHFNISNLINVISNE